MGTLLVYTRVLWMTVILVISFGRIVWVFLNLDSFIVN
ncbi:hypothetical protein LINPERPRIM_LOCUS27566 [Linum perenne]